MLKYVFLTFMHNQSGSFAKKYYYRKTYSKGTYLKVVNLKFKLFSFDSINKSLNQEEV